MNKTPILTVLAGPNGSGKSTITAKLEIIGEYVNADEIKKHLGCDDLKSAQIAEATREYLLENKKSFTFETVLSTPRNIELMRRAKDIGYTVVCIYVLTSDANINVARVRSRVQNGGHDVPTDKIVSRYKRAMTLIPELFDICDELYIYDNSKDRTEGVPKPIIRYKYGELTKIPNDIWDDNMLEQLMNGTFYQ